MCAALSLRVISPRGPVIPHVRNGLFAAAGFSTTPLDVLKTRLMTQGSTPVGTEVLYKNVFDCAARIYREEGAVAFLKGWEPRVIWISIGGCVFFTALEQCKKAFIPEGAQTASSH